MSFDLDLYLENMLAKPVIMIVTCIIILIYVVVSFIKVLKKENNYKRHFASIVALPFAIIILLSLAIQQSNFRLIKDINGSTESYVGTIDEFHSVRSSPTYYYNDGKYRAKIVVVDGAEYYIVSTSGYVIGDKVRIEYASHSKVILKINEVDDN